MNHGPSRRAFAAFLAGTLAAPLALAQTASGAVLHVAGKIKSGSVMLSLQDLQKLPQHTFTTNTPWTREPHSYTGPLLRDVLAAVGVDPSAKTIRAAALNDYQITIPVADAQAFPVIVAHLLDGKPMPIRDRGPLFVIYPFDSHPDLKTMRYYQRAIWQLKSMQVE